MSKILKLSNYLMSELLGVRKLYSKTLWSNKKYDRT